MARREGTYRHRAWLRRQRARRSPRPSRRRTPCGASEVSWPSCCWSWPASGKRRSGGERDELRQSGEATRGGRASVGATVARRGVLKAAWTRDFGARGTMCADRVPRRTRRAAPTRIREARLRNQKKKLVGTKLKKRAYERGSVASRGTHRRRHGLSLRLVVLLRHCVKCAGEFRCVGVVAREGTRARKSSPGSTNRGFATA